MTIDLAQEQLPIGTIVKWRDPETLRVYTGIVIDYAHTLGVLELDKVETGFQVIEDYHAGKSIPFTEVDIVEVMIKGSDFKMYSIEFERLTKVFSLWGSESFLRKTGH